MNVTDFNLLGPKMYSIYLWFLKLEVVEDREAV